MKKVFVVVRASVIQKSIPPKLGLLSTSTQTKLCLHCERELGAAQHAYCCSGCAAAHQLIQGLGLERFYTMQDTQKVAAFSRPVGLARQARYAIFDEQHFQSCIGVCAGEANTTVQLRVVNLRCYACVWLIEEAAKRRFPAASVRVNLSNSIISIAYPSASQKLSDMVGFIEHLGYELEPCDASGAADSDRRELVGLGVMSFCALNIMLLAFAEYLSRPGEIPTNYIELFRYAAAILASIALLFGARPLLSNAWRYMRLRRVHIDQPIVMALLAAYSYSLVGLFRPDNHLYFDSTVGAVTLLLWGRYLQKQILLRSQRLISGQSLQWNEWVRVQDPTGRYVHKPSRLLRVGEVFELLPGTLLPVRAEVLEGEAELDKAQISGEQSYVSARPGVVLMAGLLNGATPLLLKAKDDGALSFSESINNHMALLLAKKGAYQNLYDRLATYFLVAVPSIATLTAVIGGFYLGWEEAFGRACAVLLIACPCAFGLAAPLVFHRLVSLSLRAGVLFRSQDAIERLAAIKACVFDKTGTLTAGSLAVTNVRWEDEEMQKLGVSQAELAAMIAGLCGHSSHHVAVALCAWVEQAFELSGTVPVAFADVREVWSAGLHGRCRWGDIYVGRPQTTDEHDASASGQTVVVLNGLCLMRCELKDQTLDDAKKVIQRVGQLGIHTSILSGDSSIRVDQVARDLRVDDAFAGLSYTEKMYAVLRNRPEHTAMVGNGVNDTLAFAAAAVGVAVYNAPAAVKLKADVVLLRRGIAVLEDALLIARAATAALQRCLWLNVCFNGVAITFAVLGLITPLFAAILMPTSSILTIIIASSWGFRSNTSRKGL